MIYISLTQGKFALIDDEMHEWLNQWKWYARISGNTYYATRNSSRKNGKRKIIFMHREITKSLPSQYVDHKNGNGLDNQLNNLRTCNKQQNHFNQKTNKNNTSGFKGVIWHKQLNKWQSRICVNRKRIYLGHFNNIIDAAKAYNEAAMKYFGEFALLNDV